MIKGALTVQNLLTLDPGDPVVVLRAVLTEHDSIENFGEGRLKNGRGTVKVSKTFSRLARTADYYVFLTPRGDSNGLFVGRQSKTGFEVREQQGGKSSVKFSYRVVAVRKPPKGQQVPRTPSTQLGIVGLPKLPAEPAGPDRRSRVFARGKD